MKTEEFTLDKEEQTIDLGMSLGSSIRESKDKSPISIFLCGNLGTGKTTLTKGILKGLGFSGLVKSPTFNLVEIYEIQNLEIYHFDLYRINSTTELDEIDIRKSLSSQNTISIIEWPESFEDFLPSPDIRIDLSHFNLEPDSRKIRVRYLKM